VANEKKPKKKTKQCPSLHSARLAGGFEAGTREHNRLWNKLSLVMTLPPAQVEGEVFKETRKARPKMQPRNLLHTSIPRQQQMAVSRQGRVAR
jgi:hypothetical protein